MTQEQFDKAHEVLMDIRHYEAVLEMLDTADGKPLIIMPDMSIYGHVKDLYRQTTVGRIEQKKNEFFNI